MKKTVLVLGQSGSLNGKLLNEVLELLEVDCVHAVHLRYEEDPQKTLVQYLLGAGGKVFEAARNTFNLGAGCDYRRVECAVINTNLALGDSFKDGDYSQLEETFPNLQYITLTVGPQQQPVSTRIVRSPAAEAA
ncbi:hypothetical protein KC939_00135 [Candidatus Saccharibacteria bacterium]|nr:hypothetical protein [Candidatus Saccharibacteria bacterium]